MLRSRALAVAGLLAAIAASAGPAAAQTKAAYDRALAEATSQNRTVLLDFYTDW